MTSNITLGNRTFQHDFVVCKHLMRPLILGREFLFKNELKVYYSKTGECRLDYKQEELVATVDSQDDLTLTLKSGIYIPGRTVAILNVNSSVHQNDIGQFYNVRVNSLLKDEYPLLQIVPTLHKVDNAATTLIPFVMINLGEDYVFLPKGQVVGFLDAEYIDVSEIKLDIASVTVNAMDILTTIKEKLMTKIRILSLLTLSPVLLMLQDLVKLISRILKLQQKKQKLSIKYVTNMLMYFRTILVILVEPL